MSDIEIFMNRIDLKINTNMGKAQTDYRKHPKVRKQTYSVPGWVQQRNRTITLVSFGKRMCMYEVIECYENTVGNQDIMSWVSIDSDHSSYKICYENFIQLPYCRM